MYNIHAYIHTYIIIHIRHSSELFQNVSHTMCPVKNFALDSDLPLLYIDAFSSSVSGVYFSVEVEPVENFVLK